MVAQNPQASLDPALAWRMEAYARGCWKKVLVRQPTRLERAEGIREKVIAEIIMLLDEPGVFYDIRGKVVPDELARAAGFDIGRWRREGEKQRRKAEALARIEAEFAKIEAETEADASSPASV